MRYFYLIFLATALSSCAPKTTQESKLSQVLLSPRLNTEGELCFFIPPEGWLLSDPNKWLGTVQMGFLKKQEGFCPSINLAKEPTSLSQEEYLQVVQNIHESHHADRWRRLGKLSTPAGVADLTELDMTIEFGKVRLLQLILVKGGYAYTLTASALKEEMSTYYEKFHTSFCSLQLTDDLISAVPDPEKQEALRPIKEWDFERAQKEIMEKYTEMGAYWQLLFLKSLYRT